MELELQMSEQTNEIVAAFTRVQAKLHAVTKSANNPFFKSKYADLTAIQEELKPLLNEEKLVLVQWPCGGAGNTIGLATMLFHQSGQWIKFPPFFFESKDSTPQGKGGAITYMRRYSQVTIFNMTQEDDDGNRASQRNEQLQRYEIPIPQISPGFNNQEPIPHIGTQSQMQVKKPAFTGAVVENGIIKFGKFVDKRIDQIPARDWDNYFNWWDENSTKTGKPIPKNVLDLLDEVHKYREQKSHGSAIPKYDD